MFDFAADLADGVQNRDEIYGNFSQNPKSLRVLSGIVKTFTLFFDEVCKLTLPDQLQISRSKLKRKADIILSIEDTKKYVNNLYKEYNAEKSFQIISNNDF